MRYLVKYFSSSGTCQWLQFLCGTTLIEYVCQDVLNVIRFGVLIGHKVRRRSAMLLEMNGQTSSSKRTRHSEIRYYNVADQVAKG